MTCTSPFTAENSALQAYEGFAEGIYIRAVEHVLIENCEIRDNGQAVYALSMGKGCCRKRVG